MTPVRRGNRPAAEPLRETRTVLTELSAWGDTDLVADHTSLTEQARSLVPGLVGVSIAVLHEGLTFTFVASTETFAILDAMQYLDGGPCVEAANLNREVSIDDTDALNEDAWLMFARAGAVAGIRATCHCPSPRTATSSAASTCMRIKNTPSTGSTRR